MLADALMILSLVRDPLSYFRSYRNYFVAIYVAFLAFPGANLVFIFFFSQASLMRLSTQVYVTAAAVVATVWGYVATKLYLHPEPLSFRRVLANPYRPIFVFYVMYLVPVVLAIVIGWGDPSAIYTGPSTQVTYVLDGITLPSAVVAPLLLAIGATIAIAFTVYPFVVLTRLRSQIKDREVKSALKVVTLSFGVVAVVVLVTNALSSLGYSIQGSTNFLSVILLVVAVRAFRKPTFLKSFLGVVPSLDSTPTVSHADQMILVYGQGKEKFGPLSRYIMDGVNHDDRIIYFHRGDDAITREGLSDQGIDVRKLMLKGLLRLSPLGSIYQSRNAFDETALDLTQELASEARKLGKQGLRVILDFEDFMVRPVQRFVQHLMDPRWTSPDHYVHLLMAFSSAAFQGEDEAFAKLKSNIQVIDLMESLDIFSRTVGLSHNEIAGRKILLEYDPMSDYERILKSILAESASNFERTVIFTRKDSPTYSLVQRQLGSKIFIMTSRVSYPRVESENKVLLPAYDSSLLLDALNKTIEAYSAASLTIIFDSISHYIFTLGQERSYSLVRQSLEMMASDRITGIFLLNLGAHDDKTTSVFENMFDLELVSSLATRVPEVRRKLSLTSR